MSIFKQYNAAKKHSVKKREYFKEIRIPAKSTLNNNTLIEFIEIITKFIIKSMIEKQSFSKQPLKQYEIFKTHNELSLDSLIFLTKIINSKSYKS